MSAIISALIGAVAVIIAAIISYVGSTKKEHIYLNEKISIDNLTWLKEQQTIEKQKYVQEKRDVVSQQPHDYKHISQKTEKYLTIGDKEENLYNILKKEFDRVTYMISYVLKIRCTDNFWKKSLKQFLANYGYCYPNLTESNLPYVFAYIGMQYQNIIGQSFCVNSPLYNMLKERKDVIFKPNPKMSDKDEKYETLTNKDCFLNLQFKFLCLDEAIMFCVYDLNSNTTIYEAKIKYDQTFFANLINKTDNTNRPKAILDIAEKLMPDIQINQN